MPEPRPTVLFADSTAQRALSPKERELRVWQGTYVRRIIGGVVVACLSTAFFVVPTAEISAAHCAWSLVSAPNPGGKATFFTDIDGQGDDLWAVGSTKDWRLPTRTLAERLTPEGWRVVPTPNRNARDNMYMGVEYVSQTEVWAVGVAETKDGGSRNLIARWDGHWWRAITAPTTGRASDSLLAVDSAPSPDASAPTEAWAVGVSTNLSGGNARGFVLHHDGTAWARQELPALEDPFELRAVAAFSRTDVWVAGILDPYGSPQTLVMRYDGLQWSVVPTPNPGPRDLGSGLLGISGTGSTDVYVAGIGGEEPGDSLVMHYDGSTWTLEPVPAPEVDDFDGLQAIDVRSGEVWTAGLSIPSTFSFEPLVQHRSSDGTWTKETTPDPAGLNALLSIVAIEGGPVWAAGMHSPEGTRRTKNLLIRCG